MTQTQPLIVRQRLAPGRARHMQASVQAAVDCALCPEVTPERGIEILMTTGARNLSHLCSATTAVRKQADALATDPAWRRAALDWISGFWADHGHGPTWSTFLAADLWPHEYPKPARRTTMAKLYERGLLDGTKTPFGLKVSDAMNSRRRRATKRRRRSAGAPT